mgnify:CR=1 FL=1
MAQVKQVFTCCDVCNESCVTSGNRGRGYFNGPRKDAKEWAGYIRRNGKDICSECQDEEEQKEEGA